MSDWLAIVGSELAARTAPKRLSAGVLTLGCDGPTALELQHVAGRLAERINVQLGEALVRQVRFVQEAVAAPVPRARGVARARIEGDGLEAALARLGAAVARKGGGAESP
jgi:hypothetical protein